jgi:hypothetical protein
LKNPVTRTGKIGGMRGCSRPGIPTPESAERWNRRGERLAILLLELWDREQTGAGMTGIPAFDPDRALPFSSMPPLLLTPSPSGSLDRRCTSS